MCDLELFHNWEALDNKKGMVYGSRFYVKGVKYMEEKLLTHMVNARGKRSQVESKPSPAVAAMAVAAVAKGAAIRDVEGDVDAEEESLRGNVEEVLTLKEEGDAVLPEEEGWNGWAVSLSAFTALDSFMGRGRMGGREEVGESDTEVDVVKEWGGDMDNGVEEEEYQGDVVRRSKQDSKNYKKDGCIQCSLEGEVKEGIKSYRHHQA